MVASPLMGQRRIHLLTAYDIELQRGNSSLFPHDMTHVVCI